MTDKIDIHLQTNLSDDQCEIAIAIWHKIGVFTTTSDIARDNLKEENVWAETFYNYSSYTDRDVNKLKRLTTEIMDYYKKTVDYAGVDRISVRKDNESYCLICKPTKSAALSNYNRRVGSAATNLVKADKTNEGFQLGHQTFQDMLQKVETHIPDLFQRLQFFQKIQTQLMEKQIQASRTLERMNTELIGQPDTTEAKEHDAKVHEQPQVIIPNEGETNEFDRNNIRF